jgi:hypothetical protein
VGPVESFDLYRELGLNPDQAYSEPEIRAAFRKAAMRCHPDHGGSADAFWRVRYAYRVLADPALKSDYDTTGTADPDAHRPGQLREDAVNLVLQHFEQVGAQLNVEAVGNTDPVSVVRDRIRNLQRANAEAATKLARSRRAVEQIQERLRYTGERTDVLAALLRQKHQAVAGQQRKLEQSNRVCAEALCVLDDYEYTLDEDEDEPTPTIRWTVGTHNRDWDWGGGSAT